MLLWELNAMNHDNMENTKHSTGHWIDTQPIYAPFSSLPFLVFSLNKIKWSIKNKNALDMEEKKPPRLMVFSAKKILPRAS